MQDINDILARAHVYGVIALSFAYPEDRVIEEILGGANTIIEALELAGVNAETLEKGRAFVEASASTQPSEIIRSYNTLFVGRQQFRMDESEYDTSIFYRYQRVADVSGFYRAFGFERATNTFQRPDFVGTEFEFMHMLLFKLAYALEQGWGEHAESCRDAEAKFFREHLEWWIPNMCEKLRGVSSCAFYRSVSSFLESFIRSEASRYLQPVQGVC